MLLALTLACSLSLQAFAAETTPGTDTTGSGQTASDSEEVEKYALSVKTDEGCKSDVTEYTAKKGELKTVTITPLLNRSILEIAIVAGKDTATIDPSATSVTLNDQTFKVSRDDKGAVTIKLPAMMCDVQISAISKVNSNEYVLSVETDKGCTSNVETFVAKKGETKTVIITPLDNKNIPEITIVSGEETATIGYNDTSVKVNGQTYKVARGVNGVVTIEVPEMLNDVKITATSANERLVWVSDTDAAKSTEAGTNIVKGDETFAVKFIPAKDAILRKIVVTTATGTYTADVSDTHIVIEREYYRIFHDKNGNISVLFPDVPVNMTIAAVANLSSHHIVVQNDGGIESNILSTTVEDGDSANVILTPAGEKYTIKGLTIDYKGKTYKAGVTEDNEIHVYGHIFWDIEVNEDGAVIIYLTNIEDDVTIHAISNFNALKKFQVKPWSDSHSKISYTGKNPFAEDSSTTITVKASDPYVLDTVRFSMNDDAETVSPFDKTIQLDGEELKIVWKNNREMSVEIPHITGDLSVTSMSTKGELQEAPVEEDEDTDTPSTGVTTDFVNAYHAAYMKGYNNGFFGVADVLTRSQAVLLLERAVLGMDDNSLKAYSVNRYFTDVMSNSWYAGAVNYAAQNGYLSVLSSESGRFQPERGISRAEFLALLITMKGEKIDSVKFNDSFSDVSENHWAADYISYATQNGWVNGIGNGLFAPDRTITRGEICAMVNRIMGRSCDYTKAAQTGPQFMDVPVTNWAFYDVFEASNAHVASSYNGIETWG